MTTAEPTPVVGAALPNASPPPRNAIHVFRRTPRTDGGRQDATCTDCGWTHRGGSYVGHGDDKRPTGGLTAVVDAACAHIAATDHRVNVELTTWVGGTEQRGTTLIGPGS